MTLNKTRRALYAGARLLGDVQAARRGRAPQRVANHIIGRLLAALFRRAWR